MLRFFTVFLVLATILSPTFGSFSFESYEKRGEASQAFLEKTGEASCHKAKGSAREAREEREETEEEAVKEPSVTQDQREACLGCCGPGCQCSQGCSVNQVQLSIPSVLVLKPPFPLKHPILIGNLSFRLQFLTSIFHPPRIFTHSKKTS